MSLFPDPIPNWIDGREAPAASSATFEKRRPHDGQVMCRVARSNSDDVNAAVEAAKRAQPAWAAMPAVARGKVLYAMCESVAKRRNEISAVVAEETGKNLKSAVGETDGGIACGQFFAGEGQRLFGRTLTSGVANKYAMTIRQPVGVAGLIIAANTPIPNIAWKVFPALICGNGVVLKAADDTPVNAWMFAKIAAEAGLPAGVLNIVQGLGPEAGEPIVRHPDVGIVSFTGSTAVGKRLAGIAGERLAKVSLELGGKNALLVCEDADLDNAVKWSILSAFSNAGQRCASGSRLLVCDAVYDEFRDRLAAAIDALKVGPSDADDLGPVINERQLNRMLDAIESAKAEGATVLRGGHRLTDEARAGGYYLAPTVIEGSSPSAAISCTELFGPVTGLYRVRDFNDGLALANDSPYGLTACVHTRNFHRGVEFTQRVRAGVAVVNGGTFGSEPHFPFGGVKQSGNGTREPGTEALDIYSDLKATYFFTDPAQL